MHILHYTLGLPPFRSGGLTKYATDLMLAQNNTTDKVSLLYPGDYTFWKFPSKKIVQKPNFKDLTVFEMENPYPIPLLYGIKNPESIYNDLYKLSEQEIEKFYLSVKPEIFHIHTLMGLPPELLVYLKQNGVKIIFTSHDYFGLCLKVNFINQNSDVCKNAIGSACEICNRGSKSSGFLRLRNSSYLLKYKNILSPYSKINKSKVKIVEDTFHSISNPQRTLEYENIIQYYHKIFDLVDCFHFNSSVARKQYEKNITVKQAVTIPISHKGIIDNRKRRDFNHSHIKLAFIGHTTEYKGFPLFKNVLCKLENDGITNWSLDVWGGEIGIDENNNKIVYKGKFVPDKMNTVFENTDLLVVPSLWKETFSLITLEAISYAVPVIVSTNVGAKDIISRYSSELTYDTSFEGLYSKLKTILCSSEVLKKFNLEICSGEFDFLFEDHVESIKNLYLNVLRTQH